MDIWQPGFNIQIILLSYTQLALFPVAACQPLRSLAAKCAKLQREMILLPLETRRVANDQGQNFVTKSLSHLTQLIIKLFNLSVKFKPVLANLKRCTCSSRSSFSLLRQQFHNHFQNDLRLLRLCH